MKSKIIFYFFIGFLTNINAQTTIPAGNVSGTWTKTGSPYKVQGEILIPKGSTLTIEPGVIVEFDYGLTVDGVLNAIGKKGDSITFKAAFSVWKGITFYRNTQKDTIEFNYCRWENVVATQRSYDGKLPFEWRKLDILMGRGIFCAYSSPLKVKNSSFTYNSQYVLVNAPQANFIYSFKNSLIVDSVFISSPSDKNPIFSFGMITVDSVDYFSVTNVVADNIKEFSTLVSAGYIQSSVQKPSIIHNVTVTNCLKTSVLWLSHSKNIEIKNIYTNIARKTLVLGNVQNAKVNNMVCKNNFMAFGSSMECSGSILDNCVFENCGLVKEQWAIEMNSNGPLFKNCQFKSSESGIYINQKNGTGTPIFLNCNFDNSKSKAAVIEGYPVFVNCNFTNNSDYYTTKGGSINLPYMGGVVVLRELDNSRPYFYNCLFWGNKDSFGHDNSMVLFGKSVKAELVNCLVQGDSSRGIRGYDDDNFKDIFIPSGNLKYLNSNGNVPGFIDSAAGNFNLLNTCNNTAYAINKGMSGNLLTQYPFTILKSLYGIDIYKSVDLAGNPRVTDDTLDIGCYESSGTKKALKLRSTYRDTTLCFGASNTYSGNTYGTVQTYQWQKRIGTSITNHSNAPLLTLNNIQNYNTQYRLLVSNNECLPLKDSSAWFNVNINKPVKKGITKMPNKDTIQLKDTMQLSTSATGYQSFLWSNAAKSSSIKFLGSDLGPKGKYNFTIEARKNDGCLERDTVGIVTIDNKQGIFTFTRTSIQIKLYPQPAVNELGIKAENIAQIKILALDGKILESHNVTNESEITLPIQYLSAGVYILELRSTDGEVVMMKWLKE